MRQKFTHSRSWTYQCRWLPALMVALVILGCGDSLSVQPTTPSPTSSSVPSPVPSPDPSSPAATPTNPSNNAPTSVPASPSTEDELWSLLQQADNTLYVVLIRHAIAPGTGDPANFNLNDCSTQRNLSAAGQQQAAQIGEAFRSRNVPITRVLSSQWCRCLETAELMNLGKVEPFSPLNSFFDDRSRTNTQTAQIRQFVLEQNVPGVIVMVTHQVNVTALSDIFPQSGEAVVLQTGDDQQLKVLGRLPMS